MLDCAKLACVIAKAEGALFADTAGAYALLCATWQELSADPLTAYRVASISSAPWPLPFWQESLATTHSIASYEQPYTVVATDGSQIYPDRHWGNSCGLINVGTVIIPYRQPENPVRLFSEPYLMLPNEIHNGGLNPIENITVERQKYEFVHALQVIKAVTQPCLALFDGSLIFWHLEPLAGYELLVANYCALLMQLHEQRIPTAWYISMPKSKDLLNLARLHLSGYQPQREESYEAINQFSDATIAGAVLSPGQRTILFGSRSPVTALYPPQLKPYFAYIKHDTEVGRLELPAWVVQDTALCERVIAMVYDQIIKGRGYPIALAEAHEQAVVKGPDRELFYQLLERAGLRNNRSQALSQKQARKNRASI